MLLLDGIVLGLLGALLTGGRVRYLQRARFEHEPFLLIGLLVYLLWSPAGSLLRLGQQEAVFIWLLNASMLAGLALLNTTRWLGMLPVALGLTLNILVIAANGAMPVSVSAVAPVAAPDLTSSVLHEPLTSSTHLPLLADILLVPGPSWHRGVVSVGDLLLSLGAGLVIYRMAHDPGN